VPGEDPCVVLRRQELGKDGKLLGVRLLYQGSKSLMLLMSGIEAMRTWVMKGPGHIVGPSISISPRHL
jgi:hypothetical protein